MVASDGDLLLKRCDPNARRTSIVPPSADSVLGVLPRLLSSVTIVELRATGGGCVHEGWLKSEKLGNFRGTGTGEYFNWFCAVWPKVPIPNIGRLLVYFYESGGQDPTVSPETLAVKAERAAGAIVLSGCEYLKPKSDRAVDSGLPYCFRLDASRFDGWDTQRQCCIQTKQRYYFASPWKQPIKQWRERIQTEAERDDDDSESDDEHESNQQAPSAELEDLWIQYSELEIGTVIGNGVTNPDGCVYRGKAKYLGPVAIKTIPRSAGQTAPCMCEEYSLARAMRHDNILHILGVSSGPAPLAPDVDHWLIITSKCDYDLFQLLKSALDLSWKQRIKIASGIATGMMYLHGSRKVAHLDLKSANVLIKDGSPKICGMTISYIRKFSTK